MMFSGLKLAAAAALVVGGLGVASAANAAPVGPTLSGVLAADAPVTLVAGGCGRGFHPGRFGVCRPNFGPRRFYGGPRFYGRPRVVVRPYGYGRGYGYRRGYGRY